MSKPGEKKIPLQIGAILEGVSLLKDGGLSLRFSTNEVGPEDLTIMKSYHKTEGWLMFKPNQFKLAEIPMEDADLDGKSQSQRFRAVLFVLWNSLPGPKFDFETFYRQETEKVIEHYKTKLPPKPHGA